MNSLKVLSHSSIYYLQQIIDNSCSSFGDISAKDWGNYSFNGESCQTHINVSNGMSRIVDKLKESLQSNIKLNKTVDLIFWKDEEFRDKPQAIKIRCSDGSIFTTNNLICTFSLGVLKEHHLEMFSPPLPATHREVIDRIGFGTINKIFLQFEEKWWSDEWKGIQLIWNEKLNDVSVEKVLNKTKVNCLNKFGFFRIHIGRNSFPALIVLIRNQRTLCLDGSAGREPLRWKN